MTVLNERIMREMAERYTSLEAIQNAPTEATFFRQFSTSNKKDYLGGIKNRFNKYARSNEGKHYYYILVIEKAIKKIKPTTDSVARMKTAAALLENR
jgi:hypothetical protein